MEMEGCIILSFIDVFGIFLMVMNKSKSSRENNNGKKIKEESYSSSCVPNGSSLCERKNRSQENRLGVVKRGCHLYKQIDINSVRKGLKKRGTSSICLLPFIETLDIM
jgi:hypothetical protein